MGRSKLTANKLPPGAEPRPPLLPRPATMPDDLLRFNTCPPSFSLSRQLARAWPDGSPAENLSLVEDDQQSSSQETKSDEEIQSIASGSHQPHIPAATRILSISSSDSELLPEPSTLHDGNSPKRQKVIILTGMRFDDANAIDRVVYTY